MKHAHKSASVLAAISIKFGALLGGADAAVIVDYSDTPGGLTVSWSGSVNTAGLSLSNSGVNLTAPSFSRIVNGQFIATSGIGSSMNFWEGMSQGGGLVSNIGGAFGGVISGGSIPFAYQTNPAIWLPSSYVSGESISGSSFFAGASVASTGVNDTFVMNWGSGANADSLSVTINAVPEPSSLFLAGLGALGVIARRCRTS